MAGTEVLEGQRTGGLLVTGTTGTHALAGGGDGFDIHSPEPGH